MMTVESVGATFGSAQSLQQRRARSTMRESADLIGTLLLLRCAIPDSAELAPIRLLQIDTGSTRIV